MRVEEGAAACQETRRLPFTQRVIQYFPLFDNDAALHSAKIRHLRWLVVKDVSGHFGAQERPLIITSVVPW